VGPETSYGEQGSNSLVRLLPADFDRKEFLEIIGIPRDKDPIAARKKIDEVRSGVRKERVVDPYGYPRAFTHNPTNKQLAKIKEATSMTWGQEEIKVLDAFSGGGSIPLEAVRMGFDTIANELNPVATIIQKATIEYPMKFGPSLAQDIEKIGSEIESQLSKEFADIFPRKQGEEDLCYIWVRTVQCPKCGLHIPLAPNCG
jgi:adenine-specific DNA methylase